MLLVAATALLYVAERPGADAAEASTERGTAVVFESTHECDLLPAAAVFETATTVPTLRPDHQG